MKIVHVNDNDLLGSRFNGHDMQIAFNKMGISCKQFVMDKYGNSPNTILLSNNIDKQLLRKLCMWYEADFSLNAMIYPYGWSLMNHNDFQSADVVHYHLVHNYLLSISMLPILAAAKPTVYTIHDPWVFTGHCVHPINCNKWEVEKCENCPHLDRYFPMKDDNAKYMWEIKEAVFSNMDIDIVVASKWMLDMVRRSPITSHLDRIHQIPFGVDTGVFCNKHNKKSKIRERLGIDQNDTVLFFRTEVSEFKGVPYIQEMLELLDLSAPVTVLTLGTKGLIKEGSYNLVEVGRVVDSAQVSDLYTASDMFLMPSAAEAFGVMAIEAMSCELPVIVSEGTALKDVTFAPECGVLIDKNNAQQFADTVAMLIDNPDERHKRGKLGRKLVIEHYDIDTYYKNMLELYEKVSKRKPQQNSSNKMKPHHLSNDIKHFQMFSRFLTDYSDMVTVMVTQPELFKEQFGSM